MGVATGLAVLGTALWLILLLLPWRPWGTRERLEAQPGPDDDDLPDGSAISVLIPARNEAAVLGTTLDALRHQARGLRILVIDDQSGDATARLARERGGEVIAGTSPLPGWSGKLWALQQGLRTVTTPWVLLLDADIELAPGTLRALLDQAHSRRLDLVSLMAEPSLRHPVERLLMPAFVFFFKLLYPFALANGDNPHRAAAAGGCILVRREALQRIDAFACLHDALIDDCTLAARLKQAGFRTWIGLSHAARSLRAYSGLRPIWDMVARTAYTQLRYSPALLALCTLLMASLFWFAPLAPLLNPGYGYALGALSWMAMAVSYRPTLRYYGLSTLWALALPLVGTLYLAMTWTSALRYWRGTRSHWKGRRYETPTAG